MRRLLAEVVAHTKQADDEIHEDQLLNFLVNSLDEEVALTLTENAEVDAQYLTKHRQLAWLESAVLL